MSPALPHGILTLRWDLLWSHGLLPNYGLLPLTALVFPLISPWLDPGSSASRFPRTMLSPTPARSAPLIEASRSAQVAPRGSLACRSPAQMVSTPRLLLRMRGKRCVHVCGMLTHMYTALFLPTQLCITDILFYTPLLLSLNNIPWVLFYSCTCRVASFYVSYILPHFMDTAKFRWMDRSNIA